MVFKSFSEQVDACLKRHMVFSDRHQEGMGRSRVSGIGKTGGRKKILPRCFGQDFYLVEVSGIEPLTSCMPCKRSTN